ncbi:MAG: hypothetical protein WCD07_11915 [Burkholderiales bacterium]
MQVSNYIELYVAITFTFAAVVLVADSLAIPLADLVRRFTPAAKPSVLTTVHVMPKPVARKNDREWDNMQLDVAA